MTKEWHHLYEEYPSNEEIEKMNEADGKMRLTRKEYLQHHLDEQRYKTLLHLHTKMD